MYYRFLLDFLLGDTQFEFLVPVLHLSLPAKPSLFPTSAGTGINAGAQGIGSVFPLFYGYEIPL